MNVKVCGHCGMARDEVQVSICTILAINSKSFGSFFNAQYCAAEQDAKLAFKNFKPKQNSQEQAA